MQKSFFFHWKYPIIPKKDICQEGAKKTETQSQQTFTDNCNTSCLPAFILQLQITENNVGYVASLWETR